MKRTRIVDTIACAFDAIEIACDLIGKSKRKGGYLCVTDNLGQLITLTQIGQVPDKKKPKYAQFAQEKAVRLSKHSQHVSSWQSRNPREDMWGGAIRSSQFIFSFSGLPEEWDEACTLVIAHDVGELDNIEFNAIARISQNQFAASLKKSVAEID